MLPVQLLPPVFSWPSTTAGVIFNLIANYQRQTVIKRDMWFHHLLFVKVENVPLVSPYFLLLDSPLHIVLLLQNVLRVTFPGQVVTSRCRQNGLEEVRVGEASHLVGG